MIGPNPLSEMEYGDTWVYESIITALPGVSLDEQQAIVLQVAIFEVGMVALAAAYDLWEIVPVGTAAVFVAAVGSAAMLRLSHANRRTDVPETYYRLLFGSSIEVVLAVLAFIAFVTHLFVFDPRTTSPSLLVSLFGEEPPVLAVYLMLLILWDVCYRIGTSWWTAVVALWRSIRYRFDPETVRQFRRLDAMNIGFAVAQLVMVPFIRDRPVLLLALGGHVVAVTSVSVAAIALMEAE